MNDEPNIIIPHPVHPIIEPPVIQLGIPASFQMPNIVGVKAPPVTINAPPIIARIAEDGIPLLLVSFSMVHLRSHS